MFYNPWVYDIEVYPNLFTLVARKLDSKEYVKFVVHESQDDSDEVLQWLSGRPTLIGYNSIDFDGQVIEYIHRTGSFTAESVYKFVLTLPLNDEKKDRFDIPYSEWDLSFKPVDLFKLNHYDNTKTSLKWLEFTTRWGKLRDLPLDPHTEVPKSKIVEIVRYNTNDVDITYDFYYKCLSQIELRLELAQELKEPRIINMSDSSIGSYIFENILTKDLNISKKKLKRGTTYDKIYGKDILLPYVFFKSDVFNNVHQTFKDRIYLNEKGGPLVDVDGSIYKQTALFSDMVFVFGSGGLHACWKAGEFIPANDEVILSVDVKSYYPNIAIKNKFYPLHIGESFCGIYEDVYNKRKEYPKGSSFNYAYKIALNGVYGKSNSNFSIFYDLGYLLKIVVNGQLLLAMLAEALADYGRLLMVNTDGLEIIIKKKDAIKIKYICDQWEMLTGLELEYNKYRKIVIRDVNNYLAEDVDGNGKRKGMFELYDDITEEGGKQHFYNKTPNATIIPKAIWSYYMEDKPIYDTVTSENDIYEFCFGIKKQKKFDFWLITAEQSGVIDIDKRSDKVIRYYVSPGGANIYKFWKDDRKNNITGVNRGQLIELAMNITNPDIERLVKKGKVKDGTNTTELVVQYNVDKNYYIDEIQKLIDHIEAGTRDTAYQKYMKELNKEQNEV